jgi:hypothetical protein
MVCTYMLHPMLGQKKKLEARKTGLWLMEETGRLDHLEELDQTLSRGSHNGGSLVLGKMYVRYTVCTRYVGYLPR